MFTPLCTVLLASTSPRSALQLTRRSSVLGAVAAGTSLVRTRPAVADGATSMFKDDFTGVQFAYPSDWLFEQKKMDFSVVPIPIVASKERPSTNAFLSITPIRGDFGSLGSFGNPGDVLVTLVPPPGTPGVKSEVLSSVSTGSTYEFDYILRFDTGVSRHLRTAVGLTHASNGSDFLITLTCQALEADYSSSSAQLESILKSLKL